MPYLRFLRRVCFTLSYGHPAYRDLPLARRRSRRGSGSRDPMAGLSDEQRQALGLAGEWLAYQWLSRLYPEANESSWVSTTAAGCLRRPRR